MLVGSVAAQQRTPGTRTFVPSPQALGMGGAAVAYPTTRTALFYNPAHLTHLKVSRAPITMLGASLSLSNNFRQQLHFYNERLQPAIDQGIETLEESEEQALYDDVFRMGDAPAALGSELLLPSFVISRDSYGYGGGLFAHSEWLYNVDDPGTGVPGVDFTVLFDFMAVASAGTDLSTLGVQGLSVGMTAKYAQRYLTVKVKPVDAIGQDESLYVLGASAATTDLGLLYEADFLHAPGKLYFGLVWSDLALKNFDYRFSAYWAKNEEVQDNDAIAAEVATAQERYPIQSSVRAGVAYVMPGLGGPFEETAFALDYIQFKDPLVKQSLLGHLSMGVQTTMRRIFSVRAGLNQGYTTLGVGLQFSFARFDYAFYGSEQGRLPGQAASWHHRLQISLGSF
jgi:hypothetical protein